MRPKKNLTVVGGIGGEDMEVAIAWTGIPKSQWFPQGTSGEDMLNMACPPLKSVLEIGMIRSWLNADLL